MLKWIGAALVCAASAGLGFCFARDLKEREDLLAEYGRCLLMLRGEISFGAATLPACFSMIGARVGEPFAALFAEAGHVLSENPQTSLKTAWEEAAKAQLSKTPLSAEERDSICRLGSRMGHLDRDMQLATVQELLTQTKLLRSQAQQAYAEKARLFRCVGTLGGFLIVLLLL